jgi:hypothetical protein
LSARAIGFFPLRAFDCAAGIKNTSSVAIHFSNYTGYNKPISPFFSERERFILISITRERKALKPKRDILI